jgi:hypothetical protein
MALFRLYKGREILGVKVDRANLDSFPFLPPAQGYLADSKANLDSFLELFGEAAVEPEDE